MPWTYIDLHDQDNYQGALSRKKALPLSESKFILKEVRTATAQALRAKPIGVQGFLETGKAGGSVGALQRVQFIITVPPKCFDFFFNAEKGMRGHYHDSPEAGEAFSLDLIGALVPSIRAAMGVGLTMLEKVGKGPGFPVADQRLAQEVFDATLGVPVGRQKAKIGAGSTSRSRGDRDLTQSTAADPNKSTLKVIPGLGPQHFARIDTGGQWMPVDRDDAELQTAAIVAGDAYINKLEGTPALKLKLDEEEINRRGEKQFVREIVRSAGINNFPRGGFVYLPKHGKPTIELNGPFVDLSKSPPEMLVITSKQFRLHTLNSFGFI